MPHNFRGQTVQIFEPRLDVVTRNLTKEIELSFVIAMETVRDRNRPLAAVPSRKQIRVVMLQHEIATIKFLDERSGQLEPMRRRLRPLALFLRRLVGQHERSIECREIFADDSVSSSSIVRLDMASGGAPPHIVIIAAAAPLAATVMARRTARALG